jgi:WD40 repeat protein
MRLIQLDPDLADPERVARNLRFAADGRALAAVLGRPDSGRRVVVRYDLVRDAGTVIPDPSDEDELREDAPDPAVSPDLELVAEVLANYAGYDQVRLTDTWARPPEAVELPPAGDGVALTAVGFAAGGGVLLVGAASENVSDCRVGRWDMNTLFDDPDPENAWLDPLELPEGDEPAGFADTADGQSLAVGTLRGHAVIFDLTGTRRPLTVAHGHSKRPPAVRNLLFSPDGRRLATRAAGFVAVWDLATGYLLASLGGPHPLTGCAFTPDGRSLLASTADGSVCRFDADGFALLDRLAWGLGPLHSVAVAPDGLTAAAGADAGRVVVWDL